MSVDRTFTISDIDQFRTAVPKIIQAVFRGETPDSSIRIVGMGNDGAKRLCYPLSPAQLDRMQRCLSIRTQTADVTCHDDLQSECKGVLTFHVSYHFVGTEASGETLTIHEQGWIFVHCSVQGKYLFITGVEGYPHDAPLPDKLPTASSELPPSPRKVRERIRRRAMNEDVKGCCWEGFVELILELIFN